MPRPASVPEAWATNTAHAAATPTSVSAATPVAPTGVERTDVFFVEQLGVFMMPMTTLGLLLALVPLYCAAFGCVELGGSSFSTMVYTVFFGVAVGAIAVATILCSSFWLVFLSAPQPPPSGEGNAMHPLWRETGLLLSELTVVACVYLMAWMDMVPLLQDPVSKRPVLLARYLGWAASFPMLIDLDVRVAMQRPPGVPGMDSLSGLFCILFGLWGQLTSVVVLRWTFIALSWVACFVVLRIIQRAKLEGVKRVDGQRFLQRLLTVMQMVYIFVGILYHLALANHVTVDLEQYLGAFLDIFVKLVHCMLVFNMMVVMHVTSLSKQDKEVKENLWNAKVLIMFLDKSGHIGYANSQAKAALYSRELHTHCFSLAGPPEQGPEQADRQELPDLAEYISESSKKTFTDALRLVSATLCPQHITLDLVSGYPMECTLSTTRSTSAGDGLVLVGRHGLSSPKMNLGASLIGSVSVMALLEQMPNPAFAVETPGPLLVAWNPAMQEICPRPTGKTLFRRLPFFNEENRAVAEAALCATQGHESRASSKIDHPSFLLSVPTPSGDHTKLLRFVCLRFGGLSTCKGAGSVVVFCSVSNEETTTMLMPNRGTDVNMLV